MQREGGSVKKKTNQIKQNENFLYVYMAFLHCFIFFFFILYVQQRMKICKQNLKEFLETLLFINVSSIYPHKYNVCMYICSILSYFIFIHSFFISLFELMKKLKIKKYKKKNFLLHFILIINNYKNAQFIYLYLYIFFINHFCLYSE